MSNIWEFLLQTATVSLTAGFLLLLKKLFEDKLPPRWQYTIWFLLALRILLPAAVQNRYILLPLPVWTEALKSITEQNLSAGTFGPSLFSAAFDPVYLTSGLPWPAISEQSMHSLAASSLKSVTLPVSLSITDWLFLIYIAGVMICLVRYVVSYRKLRHLLRQNTYPVSPEVRNHVHDVAKKHCLRACHIEMVEGLPSAFVCGIFKPVLVLPYTVGNEETCSIELPDEKILLHELFHLKYQDALQSIFWSLLRALHWCNPFLQYIFDRIGNDMEALCDQRVLEELEGEERRDYGRILLGMTNDRYPRAFGTTSLSNGASNIALRISCIARFKKYPKGMELVSVCIFLMLLAPLFIGTSTNYINDYKLRSLEMHMVISRLERCTTLAGAADTYAKGLLTGQVSYLAASSPLEQNAYWYSLCEENPGNTRIIQDPDSGMNPLIGGLQNANGEYYLYNLRASVEGLDRYDAELLFPLHWVALPKAEWSDDKTKYYDRSWADPISGYCIYPVTIEKHRDFWQVSKREEFVTGLLPDDMTEDSPDIHNEAGMLARMAEFCPAFTYSASGETGELTLLYRTYYKPGNKQSSSDFFGKQFVIYDTSAKLDTAFQLQQNDHRFLFQFNGTDAERKAVRKIAVLAVPLESADAVPDFSKVEERIDETYIHPSAPHVSLNSNDGSFAEVRSYTEDADWDGTLSAGGGNGESAYGYGLDLFLQNFGFKDSVPSMQDVFPPAYGVRILINDELQEELILTHEGGEYR